MAELEKVTFTGLSGKKYQSTVYPLDISFNSVEAVYVITKRYLKDGVVRFACVYIGMTNDMSTRFNDHHKDACFRHNSANTICVYRVTGDTARRSAETDLIDAYTPICNG